MSHVFHSRRPQNRPRRQTITADATRSLEALGKLSSATRTVYSRKPAIGDASKTIDSKFRPPLARSTASKTFKSLSQQPPVCLCSKSSASETSSAASTLEPVPLTQGWPGEPASSCLERPPTPNYSSLLVELDTNTGANHSLSRLKQHANLRTNTSRLARPKSVRLARAPLPLVLIRPACRPALSAHRDQSPVISRRPAAKSDGRQDCPSQAEQPDANERAGTPHSTARLSVNNKQVNH